LAIAYQVHGSGDHDVVFAGPLSNIGAQWDLPEARRLFERLGRFARVIRYDRRDVGLPDPIRDDLALEAHAQDARAQHNRARSSSHGPSATSSSAASCASPNAASRPSGASLIRGCSTPQKAERLSARRLLLSIRTARCALEEKRHSRRLSWRYRSCLEAAAPGMTA
jgi:hypothetical protein